MKPRLPPEFVPENRLEELLVAAAKNTEVRPEFYRELITSSILTLGKLHSAHTVPENSHQYDTDNESEVRLVEYKGQPVVPIYSSMKRMTDVIPSEYYVNTGYFNINCKTLLQQLGPNRTYVLNPGHMVVLTLSPEQVNALLDGTIFKKLEDERKITMSLPTKQRISQETPISISRPDILPSVLIGKLAGYFRSTEDVREAFIGQIHIPSTGEPPHLALCLKLSEQSKRTFDQITIDLGPTVRSALGAKEVLDIFDLRQSMNLSANDMVRIFPE